MKSFLNDINFRINIKIFLSLLVFHIKLPYKYFFEISCGKGVKKDFLIGEFFLKNSNYINFLIH